MDKAQVDEVTRALAKVRDDLKDDLAKLRGRLTTPERRDEIAKKVREANVRAVESILKPEQVKRFHQIEDQQAGLAVFFKPEVQKALKLTEEQTKKLDKINDELKKRIKEHRDSLNELVRGRPTPRTAILMRKKSDDLQKNKMDAMDAGRELLSDEQKATLREVLGATFELQPAASGADGVLYPLVLEVGQKGHFYGYGGSKMDTNSVHAYRATVEEVLSEKEILVEVKGENSKKTISFVLKKDTKGMADGKAVNLDGEWEVLETRKIGKRTVYVVGPLKEKKEDKKDEKN